MSIVHMLVGIPGSGKTTYAKQLQAELNCRIISTDTIRNLHPTWNETLIWPEVYRLCAEIIANGEDLIYDATNVTPNVRKRFKDKLEPYHVNYDIGVYYFSTDWHVCYERIQQRNTMDGERYFPLDKVEDYGNMIIPPTDDEGFLFIKTISKETIKV